MNPRKQVIAWSRMQSPVGSLTLAMTAKGLFAVHYGEGEKVLLGLKIKANRAFRTAILEQNDVELEPVKVQLQEYFDRKRQNFDLPLDLHGTPFQKLVWEKLQTIPYGELRSYKEVAQLIGAPRAVRAIGGANNRNPVSIIIPCHRVIGSNGSLVGYGGGIEIKRYLLMLEGAIEPQAKEG